MRVATGILLLTLAVVQNSDATQTAERKFLLPPTTGELPNRLSYRDGSIYEEGHPHRVPYVVDDYFLGMLDGQYLHALDKSNLNRAYSYRIHRMVTLTNAERERLLHGLPLLSSYIPAKQRGSSSGSGSGGHQGLMGPPPPRH